jgi:hypothetical protein
MALKKSAVREIDELQRTASGQLLEESIDHVLLSADGADVDGYVGRIRSNAGDSDGVFVDIETDEDGGIVSHADLRMREPI